jgi:hypothetical protein
VTYTPTNVNNDFYIIAYNYGIGAGCTGASTATLSMTDNKGDTPTESASNNPYCVGTPPCFGEFYVWHFIHVTAGTTSFTMQCSTSGACGEPSFFGIEYSGGCTSAPCILSNVIVDQGTASETTSSVTSGQINVTNAISFSFTTTNNDEAETPAYPYTLVNNDTPAAEKSNPISAYAMPNGGVTVPSWSWTTSDGTVTAVTVLKTANSTRIYRSRIKPIK